MKNNLLYPDRLSSISTAILMVCAVLVFGGLIVGIFIEEGFAWDEPMMRDLHSISQPWLDTLFKVITRTGSVLVVLPVVAMFIYLRRRSEKITAILLIVSAAIFPLVSEILKALFRRPRPDVFPPLVVEHTFSFPSGHTLTALGVYGLIAVLLWRRGHRLLAAGAGVWVVLIALSRVYLGVHYPSDVLASLALGTIMLSIVFALDKRLKDGRTI